MGTKGFKVKTENDCFVVICSRCRQNLQFGDFTLLFCRVRQRNTRNSCCMCNTIFPFLTNRILALWCCRSHSRRLCLNSLVFSLRRQLTNQGNIHVLQSHRVPHPNFTMNTTWLDLFPVTCGSASKLSLLM